MFDIEPRLGVCSWSLQQSSPDALAQSVAKAGLRAVQLHLDPIRTGDWDQAATQQRLRDDGIRIASGMMSMEGEDYSTLDTIRETGGVRPDRTWETNLANARADAAIAEKLGITLVTFHAGFIPHDEHDPERAKLIDRLAAIARVYADRGIRIALETGQETADTLAAALEAVDAHLPSNWAVGVNFDPANMILYGMGDPVAALRTLAPRILQVHLKDATTARTPGAWGAEVPLGEGEVDWHAFLATLDEIKPACPLMIEREAGDRRLHDITHARAFITGVARAMKEHST